MNRAIRRQQERAEAKSNTKRTYTFTDAQLQAFIKEQIQDDLVRIKREAIDKSIHDLTAAFLISLSDEFGFGKVRIQRLLEKTNNQFQCILKDLVTIEDIKLWCKEMGFNYESIFVGEDSE